MHQFEVHTAALLYNSLHTARIESDGMINLHTNLQIPCVSELLLPTPSTGVFILLFFHIFTSFVEMPVKRLKRQMLYTVSEQSNPCSVNYRLHLHT